MMRRRWIIAAALLLLIVVVATFPMRLAMAWAGAERSGLTARTVTGSIWSGRLHDAQLGALPLGTIDAHLSPGALLTGDVELGFRRTDNQLGELFGRLHGSDPRGLSNLSGVSSLSGGLSRIPVDRLRFDDVTVRFDDSGRCTAAAGRLQLTVGASIAGLDLKRGLAGPIRCDGKQAIAALSGESGMERLTIHFNSQGAWRAQLAINVNNDPRMAAALALLGFKAVNDGFALNASGQF